MSGIPRRPILFDELSHSVNHTFPLGSTATEFGRETVFERRYSVTPLNELRTDIIEEDGFSVFVFAPLPLTLGSPMLPFSVTTVGDGPSGHRGVPDPIVHVVEGRNVVVAEVKVLLANPTFPALYPVNQTALREESNATLVALEAEVGIL